MGGGGGGGGAPRILRLIFCKIVLLLNYIRNVCRAAGVSMSKLIHFYLVRQGKGKRHKLIKTDICSIFASSQNISAASQQYHAVSDLVKAIDPS